MKKPLSPRIRSLFYTLPLGFLFASCASTCTESALSDIVLDDPSLLMVRIYMEKEVKEYPGHSIRVYVRDKNEQALTLKNGGVSVNDREMGIRRALVTKIPSYSGNDRVVRIEGGEDYNISVKLGDGSEYVTSVSLPPNALERFDVPESHKRSESLTVTWNKINPEYNPVLSWTRYIFINDTTHTSTSDSMLITGQTSWTFDSDFFETDLGRVERMEFKMSTEYQDDVNDAFRSESFLKCSFFAERTVKILPLEGS